MAKVNINMKTGALDAPNTHSSTAKNEVIVGIDLGTTNSLVAFIDPISNTAIAIKDDTGSRKLVPSIIHFPEKGDLIIGNDAKDKLVSAPERTIFSVKRLMGRSYSDVQAHSDYFAYQVIDSDDDRLVKVRVGDRFYTPIELSALILGQLKKRAELALGQTVRKAVITVPAYFNDAQRQATRDAGKLAGLDVLRILNEPTAASLAYGIGQSSTNTEEQKIVVYDLGGGTFDVSILSIEEDTFEVLSTNGDTFLGGDDFDRVIIDHWLSQVPKKAAQLLNHKSTAASLRVEAEKAKIALSTRQNYECVINSHSFSISRSTFEQLIAPLLAKTISACKQALKDAELQKEEIDEIVLVGGSTRVPAVKEAVRGFFNKSPNDNLDPDEVVALGAAIQADVLAGNNTDLLLLDITPLSLGIETMGGLMDVIIARNSKVPLRAARQYTTQLDGQANMRISVYQGERDLVADNRKLGEFHLKGIPAMPAGLAKVEVAFLIDADGITKVRAKELRSGVEQSIEVRPSYGLTEEEMATMLLDSLKNANADMQARALREAQVEAENLIKTTQQFINRNIKLLSEEEIKVTTNQISYLQDLLSQSDDKNSIHQEIEKLNEISRPYAERVMDLAIQTALKGKSLED